MTPPFHRLLSVHARLDGEIRQETKRRVPDGIRILRLKKLRLAVKDRMHRLLRFGGQRES